jgi:hypothetical protein
MKAPGALTGLPRDHAVIELLKGDASKFNFIFNWN